MSPNPLQIFEPLHHVGTLVWLEDQGLLVSPTETEFNNILIGQSSYQLGFFFSFLFARMLGPNLGFGGKVFNILVGNKPSLILKVFQR